jgi:branched-subunit amino acid transport protein AzlD
MAIVWPLVATEPQWTTLLLVVTGHVFYVWGITLAARKESAKKQSRLWLLKGWGVSVLGLLATALCSIGSATRELQLDPWRVFPFLIAILLIPWGRRAVLSIQTGDLKALGPAIRQAILSILFIDASLALQFAGKGCGLLVCLMVIPTIALGRWFRST